MRTICIAFSLFLCVFARSVYAVEIDLAAIAQIESGGCKTPCIGDKGLAYGPYQLHAGAVKDVNRALGTKYSHRDVLDPKVAVIVANAYFERVIPGYLKHFNLRDSLENRLTAYNMGIKAVIRGKRAVAYIDKYYEALGVRVVIEQGAKGMVSAWQVEKIYAGLRKQYGVDSAPLLIIGRDRDRSRAGCARQVRPGEYWIGLSKGRYRSVTALLTHELRHVLYREMSEAQRVKVGGNSERFAKGFDKQ